MNLISSGEKIMVIRRLLFLTAILAAFSCSSGKYPLPVPEKNKTQPADKGPADDPGENPGEDPDDKQGENTGDNDAPDIDPGKVTLLDEFSESFDNTAASEYFVISSDEFTSFPGFPSLTEKDSKILLLRYLGNGVSVTSKNYGHFGSYVVRMRLPDVTSAQSGVGTSVKFGPEGYELEVKLSSPVVTGSVDVSKKFYILGIDWSADKLEYWAKSSASGTKTVIAEIAESVPQYPKKLKLSYATASGTAPKYPYELEIDWMSYTPFDKYNPYL